MTDPRATHQPDTPDDEWRIREAGLDDTIAASFPASDPPSSDPNPEADDLRDIPAEEDDNEP
jgi:hypothetical protein